ncbi:MAG: lysozyme inhibitor LprI family protein [Smithellaceae bacterium]
MTFWKYIIIVTALFIMSASISTAQGNKSDHPIDKWFEKCVAQDDSTAGMRECYSKAYDLWDKELNKAYIKLMNKAHTEGKKALKSAQQSWIRYRDSEFKLNNQIVGTRDGTMWLLVGDKDRMQIIKERALELRRYADILDE